MSVSGTEISYHKSMKKEHPPLTFNGRRYYFRNGYYLSTNPSTRMHRDVWIYHRGIIPLGYHIHHKDRVSWNNNINNLECLSPREHAEAHRILGFRIRKKRVFSITATVSFGPIKPIIMVTLAVKPEPYIRAKLKPPRIRKIPIRLATVVVAGKFWQWDDNRGCYRSVDSLAQ